MSADEWKTCPRCYRTYKELFETHKDNQDTPLNYEEIKQLELLKEAFKTGYPRHIDETDIKKKNLTLIEDKLRESNNYGSADLHPSSGNFRPVEIRYEYAVKEDGAWFRLMAECRNCGHEYEVEKR